MDKNYKGFSHNIPNIISAFRILLVFCFIYLFIDAAYLYCLGVYLIAFISDLLDGYLARRNGWITPIGKLLDPFADKMMLITSLVCFTTKEWIPLWITIVIVAKELLMCIVGLILYRKKVVVEANISGKVATGLWTAGIVMTILANLFVEFEPVASIVVMCALASSIMAMLSYAVKYLFAQNAKEND